MKENLTVFTESALALQLYEVDSALILSEQEQKDAENVKRHLGLLETGDQHGELHEDALAAYEADDGNCQVCAGSSQPDKLLLCDTCDKGWHTFCLKPQLKTIPEGAWNCPRCQPKKKAANDSKSKSR